ncbi:hypothetical protein LNAOJCKE_4568 [Methylorubrum aminovorans]|uniref:Uncharacterized protein n=1 Tax=Methylorubrum aminovorans TaxID=269069 RepID=A0ABQ4UJN6_9HYPH|nr:hypothetical protein [Methylorubrum aminovorans]GJE67337.1 hypothetical protein LNAOJCKE_4568 [Methylorubrum aminovorans]
MSDERRGDWYRRKPDEGEWEHTRRIALSPIRPPDWPEGVRSISIEGVGLLGVHEKSGELYWDGKPVAIRPPVRLGTFERWAAALATMGTVGTFIVELGRSAKWWAG